MAATVYIETSVFSARFSHRRDPASLYRRQATEQWWIQERLRYTLSTSLAVVDELRAGVYPGQGEAVAMAESLPAIPVTDEALEVAEIYIRHHLMPEGAGGDAPHLALASLREVDYLLTWNIRHLANPNKVDHMAVINRRLGLMSPVILSPDMLWHEEMP